jgi:hypothetical protein
MENYCDWCHQADDLKTPAIQSVVRGSGTSCPECRRRIILVGIPRAADAIGMSTKTMYKWIQKGLVSSVRTPGGRTLICFSSLFVPPEESDDSQSPHKVKKVSRSGKIR